MNGTLLCIGNTGYLLIKVHSEFSDVYSLMDMKQMDKWNKIVCVLKEFSF